MAAGPADHAMTQFDPARHGETAFDSVVEEHSLAHGCVKITGEFDRARAGITAMSPRLLAFSNFCTLPNASSK